MRRAVPFALALFTVLFTVLSVPPLLSGSRAIACTGLTLTAGDGSPIFGRTLEFTDGVLSFDLAMIPRGHEFTAQTPSGRAGMRWKAKYAQVGFSPFGMELLADGLNEKGLSCGAFYLPGFAEYEKIAVAENPRAISNVDFVSWVLSSFADVAEARKGIEKVKVGGVVIEQLGLVPPLHYFLEDEHGDAAVVEYVDGALHMYKPSPGVITNSPSYDWHLTNIRNYIGLQALNRPAKELGGQEFGQIGQGSGAIGLPGDFTPPSRFIRAVFMSHAALPGETALEGVEMAFKILNQFDIPMGVVRETVDGKTKYDVTQWTSVSDHRNRRYYFHTQHNRQLRMVDFNSLEVNAKEVQSIPVDHHQQIEDVSGRLAKQLPPPDSY